MSTYDELNEALRREEAARWDEWAAGFNDPPRIHRCPPAGEGTMPCCGRTPFEVSRSDGMTIDPDAVTCVR